MEGSKLQLDTDGLDSVLFGEQMRKKEFCLRPKSVFLNHGSYGAVPRRILDIQQRYMAEMESHPDHWFRRTLLGQWNDARQVVADFVGADIDNFFFVQNATHGVNTVLRSLKFKPGDAILASNLTYISMKKLWDDLIESSRPEGVEGLSIEIKLPIVSEDDIVRRYDEYLRQHPKVRFVLIDHITSPSAIVMPVKRLVDVIHCHGAMVMVDGAHAPGQLKLCLRELGVDFYTGNMYKWAYSPRGCAFLYVKPDYQDLIRPPVTSPQKGKALSLQFLEQGTRDHVPFLCSRFAVEFYQAIGGMEKAVSYMSGMATQGRQLLIKELQLEPLAVPPSMEAPCIIALKLPGIPESCSGLDIWEAQKKMMDDLFQEHDLQILVEVIDGALYIRLCFQIYNTLDDTRKTIAPLQRMLGNCAPYPQH